MPTYMIQKEYTNWDQITIEADSKEQALQIAEDEWEEHEYMTVNSYEYTGEVYIEEVA